MNPQPAAARPRTALDVVADDYVTRYATLDPVAATFMGLPGHDDRLTDYSPDGAAARADLHRNTLAAVRATPVVDAVDRITADAMVERLETELGLFAAGEHRRSLNVAASPVQGLREVFDVTPTATVDDLDVVVARLAAMPAAITGYIAGLRRSVALGEPPAARQVDKCAEQCDENVGPTGFFATFVTALAARPDVTPALAHQLRSAGDVAADAYADLARTLREEFAPAATPTDSVGRERYTMLLRDYLGSEVDLDETYAWGIEEVRHWRDEGERVADHITAGGLPAAVEALDADPARRIVGPEAFRDWMQQVSDEAVAALAGVHFDIPEPARRLECRIAPSNTGIVYYQGPSEDFSRPGSMWWSVPKETTSFGTWQQRTIVYHEGVPGHHLQISSAVMRSADLNMFRRLLCWVPGHGEGWALYAERLMAELGFLSEPGDRMGLIASQLLRSARVVVDIGVHCGLAAPDEAGGGPWTYDKAWAYLSTIVPEPEETLRFELDRYMGWAGQAPSYKIGERTWLELRDQAKRHRGYDPVTWHRHALDLGSVGLATLVRALGR